MSIGHRGLALALTILCVVGCAFAQTASNPQQEKDADNLLTQGEGKMKVAAYDDAIAVFRNIMKRYPDTQVRYKAEFRMADALVSQKKEPDALALLNTIVKEESTEWSPQAMMRIGEIYSSEQKYTEAFREYKLVVVDYPSNPIVDHAYFAMGKLHFLLGHFEQAYKELDKVGTVFAAASDNMQRVVPGEPLYVRLIEPNTVAKLSTTIPVTVTTKSGDRETISLAPEAEGSDHFGATIQTALGDAKAGDGVLQLHGDDIVTLVYKSRYVGEGGVERKVVMPVASTGRVLVRDSTGNEVKGVVEGDTILIEVNDPDMDRTNQPDTLSVQLDTKKKDQEKLTLTETGAHTGIFRGSIKVVAGAPTPNSGVIETNADLAEDSNTQLDDYIKVTYKDEQFLGQKSNETLDVTARVIIYKASNADLKVPVPDPGDPSMEIKTLLYKGKSLTQIAATYRDLGQSTLGIITFHKANDQFQTLLTKYPHAPEVEDAMYGLFNNYVEQELYDSAIGMVNQITRRFPQSTRASEAMLQLAALHVKREEYDRALGIYNNLAQSAKGTPVAEEAQYCICTTYMEMLKPKAGSVDVPPVTREQVAASLEQYAQNYPTSDRAPEAIWQLVRLRNDAEDYRGAVDTARRMVAIYPENVMAGRVMLLMAGAQVKLHDIDGAKDTYRVIIANYGSESDQAEKELAALERKHPSASTTTTSAGN